MKKRIIIILSVLIFVTIGGLFIINHNKSLASPVEENNKGTLAIMVYDEATSEYIKQDTVPVGNYKVNEEKTHCTAEGKIRRYNPNTGSLTYSLSAADQCYIYFDLQENLNFSSGANLVESVVSMGQNNTMSNSNTWGIIHETFVDESTGQTIDTGYRYEGANPNNYICFGSKEDICPEDNLYRIIGAFETEYDTNGDLLTDTTSNLIKVRKYTVYGASNFLFHNIHTYATNSNYLNSYFYNMFNESWYTNLAEVFKNQIISVNWNLGAVGPIYSNLNVKDFYVQERSEQSAINNLEIAGIFKIGLIYPSDYGFAVLDTNCSRDVLLRYNYEYPDCYKNWLFDAGIYQYTITPRNSPDNAGVYYLHPEGLVSQTYTSTAMTVRPTFYLDPNLIITSGKGTYTDPYKIALPE